MDEDYTMSDVESDESPISNQEITLNIISRDTEIQKSFDNCITSISTIDSEGRNVLHHAAYNGNLPLVTKLCKIFSVNSKDSCDRTPLHYAVSGNSLSVVEFLHQNDADVYAQDIHGMNPFHWSILLNNESIRLFFITKGLPETDIPPEGVTIDDKPIF